jgi:hypothetical protein
MTKNGWLRHATGDVFRLDAELQACQDDSRWDALSAELIGARAYALRMVDIIATDLKELCQLYTSAVATERDYPDYASTIGL